MAMYHSPHTRPLITMCVRLLLVVICLPVLMTMSTDGIEPENKSLKHQFRILKFAIETLKNTISAKKSVLQDLKDCTGSTLRISRNTDEISTYPTSKLLEELIQLTELESAMYHKVRLHIRQLFPTFLIAGGPGKSSEMIATLRTFLNDITNMSVNAQDRKHNVSCEDSDIQRPRHHLVSNHYIRYDVNRSCSGPSYGMVLLPGGSYVLPFSDHLEFCGPNNTLLRHKPLRRESYKIVYYKYTFVLVESFAHRFKTIKRTSHLGGKDLLFARYNGQESSGIAVYGENVFVVSKFTSLEVYSSGRFTRINKGHGRYSESVDLKNSEPGSDYGVIAGEIVERLPVLIRSSGMKICVINYPRLSENGYVTVNGDVYIAAPGNNRVLIFDKECSRYDEYIQLPPRHYVQEIVGLDDVIMITVYEANLRERYIAIYVKGSTTSPFSFNWD